MSWREDHEDFQNECFYCPVFGGKKKNTKAHKNFITKKQINTIIQSYGGGHNWVFREDLSENGIITYTGKNKRNMLTINQYWELDIGTTGTVTPGQTSGVYNNGTKITRGAARLVYGRNDLNRNGVFETNELYVFYTYNHYNDFQEYLNYYGGWGEMFGNITGGGKISSKYDYNPTPYVRTVKADITKMTAIVIFDGYFLVVDNKVYA